MSAKVLKIVWLVAQIGTKPPTTQNCYLCSTCIFGMVLQIYLPEQYVEWHQKAPQVLYSHSQLPCIVFQNGGDSLV